MAAFARQTLIPVLQRAGLPVLGGGAAGFATALTVAVAPGGWLAGATAGLGLADLAGDGPSPAWRAGLALAVGAVALAVAWAALYLLWGPGGILAAAPRRTDGFPAVRRADAHPDAPPRRPLSAAELTEWTVAAAPIGRALTPEPALPVPVAGPFERDVPADLDTPLAALDPAAIPPTPLEPVRVLAPLAPGERLETFALTRPARAPAPAEPPSIEALLRRLEAGAERRIARAG